MLRGVVSYESPSQVSRIVDVPFVLREGQFHSWLFSSVVVEKGLLESTIFLLASSSKQIRHACCSSSGGGDPALVDGDLSC